MLDKILSKIRGLNEALPGVFLLDVVYLLIGELIILLFVPDKRLCAVGFLAGVIYSVFCSVQMSYKIRKVVFGMASATKTYLLGYFLRLAVMIVLFAILYILDWGDLLSALMGMFSMKVSAYLQPFTDKFLTKIKKRKVRRWEAQ